MRETRIHKVVINIGVGGGERLPKAETLLKRITGRKPVRTKAKVTEPAFSIRKKQQIGIKVTLRGRDAEKFLGDALVAINKNLKESCFDSQGNFSFGIRESIDLPGLKYDPEIGIFGFDVSVELERRGYRVKRRTVRKSKIGKSHLLTKQDGINFARDELGVNILGDA